MSHFVLTGYIYRNADGMFVSHCSELDTDTWAPSLEEVKRLTPGMIETYFLMAEKMGMLENVLARLSPAKEELTRGSVMQARWRATLTIEGASHFSAQFEGIQAAA